MKSIIIYLGYFLLPYLALSQQSPISQIDTLMEAAHHRGIFNGNILIYHHGIKIYERSFGFADIEKKLPLTSAMKFDIGSISKEFNAVGIMVLKEKGKLSLDDSLAKYYPSFPQWANQVKIRHLLNYTSGVPILGPQADGNDTLILKSLDTLKRLVAEPGSTYIYNHINVSLQRSIIEKVSGLSYSTFVSQYLLTPLGMNNSTVDLPVESRSMARAYDGMGKNVRYEQATKGWVSFRRMTFINGLWG